VLPLQLAAERLKFRSNLALADSGHSKDPERIPFVTNAEKGTSSCLEKHLSPVSCRQHLLKPWNGLAITAESNIQEAKHFPRAQAARIDLDLSPVRGNCFVERAAPTSRIALHFMHTRLLCSRRGEANSDRELRKSFGNAAKPRPPIRRSHRSPGTPRFDCHHVPASRKHLPIHSFSADSPSGKSTRFEGESLRSQEWHSLIDGVSHTHDGIFRPSNGHRNTARPIPDFEPKGGMQTLLINVHSLG
jgi:hypothetical protein